MMLFLDRILIFSQLFIKIYKNLLNIGFFYQFFKELLFDYGKVFVAIKGLVCVVLQELSELLFGLNVGLDFEDEFLCEEGGEKGEVEDRCGEGHFWCDSSWILILIID